MENITILHIIGDPKFEKIIRDTFLIKNIRNDFYFETQIHELDELEKYDVIFFHYLSDFVAEYFSTKTYRAKSVWYLYGHDAFRFTKFHNCFYERHTRNLVYRLACKRGFRYAVSYFLKSTFREFFAKYYDNKTTLSYIKSLDFIVPVVPSDYDLFKSKYETSAKVYHFNYVLSGINNYNILNGGNSILLGNSATLSNNHIEAINILDIKNLQNIENIYFPLNYGNRDSALYIESYAVKKLGDKAVILDKFLPLEEYNFILANCGIIIMNHKRQQALGNIIQGLSNGSHIYLNEKSPIYDFLVENDFIISVLSPKIKLVTLNEDQKKHNLRVCTEVFGAEKQHDKIHRFLKNLL